MYNTIVVQNIWENSLLWKLKLLLKIKIFLWYLNKGLILTKDNLVHWNRTGNKKCAFCDCEENIQHLFFDCHYAKFIWRSLQFTFNIQSPISINDMFTDWLLTLGRKQMRQILVGATTLCWSIYEKVGMTSSLTTLWLKLICMYYLRQCIGVDNGRYYNQVRWTPRRLMTHIVL
jgi:hypothetical protein